MLLLLALWAAMSINGEFQLHGLRNDLASLPEQGRGELEDQLRYLERESPPAEYFTSQVSAWVILGHALKGLIVDLGKVVIVAVLVLTAPLLLTLFEEGTVSPRSPLTWRHILLIALTVGAVVLLSSRRARSDAPNEDDL